MGLKTRLRIRVRNRRRQTEDRKLDQAFIGGAFMFAVGWGWIYPPLLLIVGGTMVTATAWALGRTKPARNTRADENDDEDD